MENGEWGLAGIVFEVQRGTIMDFFMKMNRTFRKCINDRAELKSINLPFPRNE